MARSRTAGVSTKASACFACLRTFFGIFTPPTRFGTLVFAIVGSNQGHSTTISARMPSVLCAALKLRTA